MTAIQTAIEIELFQVENPRRRPPFGLIWITEGVLRLIPYDHDEVRARLKAVGLDFIDELRGHHKEIDFVRGLNGHPYLQLVRLKEESGQGVRFSCLSPGWREILSMASVSGKRLPAA